MTTDNLYSQLEKLSQDFNSYDSDTIREELQLFFDRLNIKFNSTDSPELYNDLTKNGHAVLKRLYNTTSVMVEDFNKCNITAYFENLCFCFDLLSGDWNKRIFFNFDKIQDSFYCSPKRLGWAFLNILSNAIIYSDGRYISVTQKSTDDKIIFLIENEGNFKYNKFLEFPRKQDGGLNCANKIINAHGGTLCMSSLEGKTSVIMSLPKKDCPESCPEYEIPGIDELLYDRLSMIYTALCDI